MLDKCIFTWGKKSIKILLCMCDCQGKHAVIIFWPVTTFGINMVSKKYPV